MVYFNLIDESVLTQAYLKKQGNLRTIADSRIRFHMYICDVKQFVRAVVYQKKKVMNSLKRHTERFSF